MASSKDELWTAASPPRQGDHVAGWEADASRRPPWSARPVRLPEEIAGAGTRSRTYEPGAGSSGACLVLPRLEGGAVCSPERSSTQLDQASHQLPVRCSAFARQACGSVPGSPPTQ